MSAQVEITGISKAFATAKGPLVVVRDFNLRIARGEFVTLIGHSGCGKSTVLSMLAGLSDATTGGIVLMGRKTFSSLPKPLPNRTNVVFTRGPRLLSHDTAFLAKCGDKPIVGSWGMRLRRQGFQLGFERIAEREIWLVRGINRFLAAARIPAGAAVDHGRVAADRQSSRATTARSGDSRGGGGAGLRGGASVGLPRGKEGGES